jgi:hypothetical protein
MKSLCRNCARSIKEELYYATFGACSIEDMKSDPADWECFMNIGKHSQDGIDDIDQEVTCENGTTQCDLSFCSLSCMKMFFNSIFDSLQPVK